MSNAVYSIITDRVVSLLERGVVPWRRPWAGPEGMPRNLVSDREYRGVNVFLLASAGYVSPHWLTFKQAQ
jgi:antirestriction protein ArdC